MPYNAMFDTYDIMAALIAELQAIKDYSQTPEIGLAQAQVVRRLALRFQITSRELAEEMYRNGLMEGGD